MVDENDLGLINLNVGISNALRTFRQEAKLSQSDLARMVGVDQSTISRLERQQCESYPLSTIYRIFSKMGLDIEIAFIEKEQKTQTEDISNGQIPV